MKRLTIRRQRNVKVVATLGPSTTSYEQIRAVYEAGADVFRLNFSHGEHAEHAARMEIIRHIEQEFGRPIGVMADMQGPKLRVGRFENGKVTLNEGDKFTLDLEPSLGDSSRVQLPHKEILQALEPGVALLLDDGRIRLNVMGCSSDRAETEVVVGGTLSDRKGVNVPGVILPLSPLTEKDKKDLAYALEIGAD